LRRLVEIRSSKKVGWAEFLHQPRVYDTPDVRGPSFFSTVAHTNSMKVRGSYLMKDTYMFNIS